MLPSFQDNNMMRWGMILVVAFSLLFVHFVSSSYAGGKPAQEYRFSVSAKEHCILHDYGQNKRCLEGFLVDLFEPGLNVSLVGERGVCSAKILDTCNYCDPNYGVRQGSQLLMDQQCEGGGVAVVSRDRAAVHLVPAQEDNSPLPKNIELKARRLLLESLEKVHGTAKDHPRAPRLKVLNDPPKVLRTEQGILLLFKYYDDFFGYKFNGHVLVVRNHFVPLLHTQDHLFFTVNDKLHLTYRVMHPAASRVYPEVYELSRGMPRNVYSGSRKQQRIELRVPLLACPAV